MPSLLRPGARSDWYFLKSNRLRPFENEVVSGEMRVQITFEQYKVRISNWPLHLRHIDPTLIPRRSAH